MSLRINHNIAAIDAQRNLALTTDNIGGVMEKLSSGFRINRASDDPAGLVISEQFRAQIAGLDRAISNSEGSISMIQTAEGSLNEINSLLVSMRELAIHAANEGFNDTAQLAADQAEIENAISTIDRIAANAQFGTKKLLDGSKDNIATITSSNSTEITIVQSGLNTGSHSVTATQTANSTASLNTVAFGVSLDSSTNGNPVNLAEGIHNVDVLTASEGAEKISGNVQLLDAWNNSLSLATTASAAIIYGQDINAGGLAGSAAGAADLAGTYSVKLNYQQNGEAVTGAQTLSVELEATDDEAAVVQAWNDAISNNAFLAGKVEMATVGVGGGDVRYQFQSVNSGAQYSLKISDSTHDSTTDFFDFENAGAALGYRDHRGTSLNTLKMKVTTDTHAAVTADVLIGGNGAAQTYSSMSALVTDVQAALDDAGAFGADEVKVVAYDNDTKLRFTTLDEGSDYKLRIMDEDTGTYERAQNVLNIAVDNDDISGTDALLSFDGYTNQISSVVHGATGTATLYNKADDGGENLGRGSLDIVVNKAEVGVNLGSMLLDVSAAKFSVRLDGGPATTVTAGMESTVYNSARDEYLNLRIGLTSTGGSETIQNTDQSLVFQIGANVGQTARIALPNMAASALGKNMAGNMFTDLSKINVLTVSGAQDSQAIIDAAITEVTTVRGTLGSFTKNTLESNLRNLRVASQNLTASESGIRDTDMASAMSEFVKYQILLQAGTAMLAQGNQLPQVVLSLFQ